jgi:RNA polymerase sigma-B factor
MGNAAAAVAGASGAAAGPHLSSKAPDRLAIRPGIDRPAANDRALFQRYREWGDAVARERLIQRYMPLAQRLARRYAWGREPVDDLVQVAFLGLVKAVDRFEHDRGVAFTSYAVPTIAGELKRHLRDASWSVHLSQRMRQRVIDVSRAADELRARLGRSATAEEIAQEIGISPAEVGEAVEAASAYDATSLQGERSSISEDNRFETVEYGAVLEPALSALPPRERAILWLRFGLDLTQSEIAGRLGMSQMHVSRLLRRSLERLHALAAQASL